MQQQPTAVLESAAYFCCLCSLEVEHTLLQKTKSLFMVTTPISLQSFNVQLPVMHSEKGPFDNRYKGGLWLIM
jgi:hypothetical protein